MTQDDGSRKHHGDVMVDVTPQTVAGSNEMVERVAKSVFFERYKGQGISWDSALGGTRDWCLVDARAAISAMREPTQGMIEAGIDAYSYLDSRDRATMVVSVLFRAMADAALIGGPPSTDDGLKI